LCLLCCCCCWYVVLLFVHLSICNVAVNINCETEVRKICTDQMNKPRKRSCNQSAYLRIFQLKLTKHRTKQHIQQNNRRTLIDLSAILIIRAPNSTPIVKSCTGWKRLSVNCKRRHDLPTPVIIIVVIESKSKYIRYRRQWRKKC